MFFSGLLYFNDPFEIREVFLYWHRDAVFSKKRPNRIFGICELVTEERCFCLRVFKFWIAVCSAVRMNHQPDGFRLMEFDGFRDLVEKIRALVFVCRACKTPRAARDFDQ